MVATDFRRRDLAIRPKTAMNAMPRGQSLKRRGESGKPSHATRCRPALAVNAGFTTSMDGSAWKPGKPPVNGTAQPEPVSSPPVTVLIVENEAALGKMLKLGLSLYGFTVHLANNQQQALD